MTIRFSSLKLAIVTTVALTAAAGLPLLSWAKTARMIQMRKRPSRVTSMTGPTIT